MSALTIVFTVLQVLSGLAVTVVVLMQSGKSAGLSGSISGGAETFLSKGKAKTWDAKLAKLTPIFALVFVVLGGIGNIRGSVIAAVVLTALPEMLRGLSNYRMLIYSIILIAMMLFNWAPKVLATREQIRAKLFRKKSKGVS